MKLVSASQINLWRDCKRKWGFKYISKLPDPSGPAAALGTEVDDTQLQPYLRDGTPFDYSRRSGYIAQPGLVFLPKPGTFKLEVQKHFEMPSPTFVEDESVQVKSPLTGKELGHPLKHIGFGYQGYIDLWLPEGGMPEIDGNYPCVTDFKTTGNWAYMKTPTDLATDVQAQLYATWAMFSTGFRTIDLAWIYFGTKGQYKARRSHLRVSADQVAEQFSKINDTALVMYEARNTVTDPFELDATPSACGMYGGCPYQSKCNLSPTVTVDEMVKRHREKQMANTSMSTMSLLERLRAEKAAAGGMAKGGIPVENLPSHVVGINPPESKLPPAPPVGKVVEAVSEEAAAVFEAATKRTRGPNKAKEESVQPWSRTLITVKVRPNPTIDVAVELTDTLQDGEDMHAALKRLGVYMGPV